MIYYLIHGVSIESGIHLTVRTFDGGREKPLYSKTIREQEIIANTILVSAALQHMNYEKARSFIDSKYEIRIQVIGLEHHTGTA
jgi:hypothetical protein